MKMVRQTNHRAPFYGLFALLALISVSCGNQFNCRLQGDNLKGRVFFANSVTLLPGSRVQIEASTDSFATLHRSAGIQNDQGLVAINYSLCVDNNTDIRLRAFQDENKDGFWQSGEANGRHDNDGANHASSIVIRIPTSEIEWQTRENVDFFLDQTDAQ